MARTTSVISFTPELTSVANLSANCPSLTPGLEDTTELDFNGQEAKGLGPLSHEAQRGMYVHPTYAVTPEREPLGILNAWMWARTRRARAAWRS